jgi:adenylate cyclase
MFTDVRGFTTISEHYGEDVQGLTKIMNRYMTAMTKKIIENNGTLDKYIGDAQMAFWNAPLDNDNHAEDSVRTALAMMESLDEFNNEIVSEGIPAFGMGLGINTDTVVVGNMGSDQRFDYTCLGDGVNTAARLEGQSKNYGVKILLGPKTAEAVKDDYTILELDNIAVKGKTVGVQIYTVIDSKSATTLAAQKHHEVMHAKYRDQDFEAVIAYCKSLKLEFGGVMKDYYEMWIQRCEDLMQQDLPVNWDGVFRATSK